MTLIREGQLNLKKFIQNKYHYFRPSIAAQIKNRTFPCPSFLILATTLSLWESVASQLSLRECGNLTPEHIRYSANKWAFLISVKNESIKLSLHLVRQTSGTIQTKCGIDRNEIWKKTWFTPHSLPPFVSTNNQM